MTNYFYGYKLPQIIQKSDRIILDARQSHIFTAGEHIHIGAGSKILISSEDETIIDSSNISAISFTSLFVSDFADNPSSNI